MGALLLHLLGWIGVIALIAVLIVTIICALTVTVMVLDACGEALRKWRADRAER